jgi:hypothetical protein
MNCGRNWLKCQFVQLTPHVNSMGFAMYILGGLTTKQRNSSGGLSQNYRFLKKNEKKIWVLFVRNSV